MKVEILEKLEEIPEFASFAQMAAIIERNNAVVDRLRRGLADERRIVISCLRLKAARTEFYRLHGLAPPEKRGNPE